jgi:hypothetical protein
VAHPPCDVVRQLHPAAAATSAAATAEVHRLWARLRRGLSLPRLQDG